MKKVFVLFMTVALVGLASAAFAASTATATQDVNITIPESTAIATTGTGSLTLVVPAAGTDFSPVTDNTNCTYDVSTNVGSGAAKKITAAITTGGNMPANTTLTATLVAPTQGTANSNVTLSTVAADMVTGVYKTLSSGLVVSYTLGATYLADPFSGTKTITYTITP